jgi:putative ABC transport system substrate-binding protein
MVLVGVATIAWSVASYAQPRQSAPQPQKRIGILTLFGCPVAPDGPYKPMLRRLTELGWVEGQTFVFDCVSTVGRLNDVQALARELVSRHPDVLIAGQWALVVALKQETSTIPIVMLGTWEPVRLGLITSLGRPEGNVTGVAWLVLLPKQMELLKEILPYMRRVAYILGISGPNPPPEVSKIAEEDLKSVANTLGLTWQIFQAAVANDYDEIFARITAEHFDAAYIPETAINIQNAARIRELALRHRIPAASEAPEWAQGEGGLLLAYAQDNPWGFALAAEYVDKILRGAKPSDLPVEQATKFELAINLKTAKTLGLTVPHSLIARADKAIE